eukprot:Gregarina_sp_Pseudo_9__5475@NODE_697_length_2351_cov_40_483564_g659_i0_p1_GENE_NODE_697_length_2351_cov_40_483564_g659_i0NODE_697_length_2351_cov_40_483564_g659_i0_p1_ORF_typecomplete_len730_score200_78Peptidase_M24/PF00557_24/5_8e47Creatinase_N_2/PF16189_5/58Creatinase_N_2/PF16189_5/8_8e40Creatinase_N/PF01321_18/6_5e22Creatinase_N/PF01321_18/0_0043Peptidase_M24_C/PF16188_5/1e15_NODE_697_length_2351_cov_40_483564_g659_i01622315
MRVVRRVSSVVIVWYFAPCVWTAPSHIGVSASPLEAETNSKSAAKFYQQLFSEDVGVEEGAQSIEEAASMTSSPAVFSPEQKLGKLREHMKQYGLDAYLVPSGDAHNSEEPVMADARRRFISNFTGSAGSAIIGLQRAWLWTDGRYFLQAEDQLDADCWELMRSNTANVPKMIDFIKDSNFTHVGFDPYLHTNDWMDDMKKALNETKITLVPVHQGTTTEAETRSLEQMSGIDKGQLNLVDLVWEEEGTRPAYPSKPISKFSEEYQGQTISEKLASVREKMKDQSAGILVLAALDDIAWLYNLRGDDPNSAREFLSYALVTMDQALLFVTNLGVDGRMPADSQASLKAASVEVKDYAKIGQDLVGIVGGLPAEQNVWIDVAVNLAVTTMARAAAGNKKARMLLQKSPVALMKAIKNAAEVRGMVDAHVQDGFALSQFLAYLDSLTPAELSNQTEIDVSDRLEAFRATRPGFIKISFDSISAVGSNGAVIHYRAEKETAKKMDPRGMYLIDSGGHYTGGTTDVTRTVHMGIPSDWEKELYTRVLMGHVDLAKVVFPDKMYGCQLDVLARSPLWEIGMDYRHGTGHGVGSSLAVHEGPPNISYRCPPSSIDVAFKPGMVVSDEPGCYIDGKFGIRIENMMVCVPRVTAHQFDGANYVGFDMLTVVPYCRKLIKTELLSKAQIKYIDEYHEYVRQLFMPMAGTDHQLIAWLNHACAPLSA